MPDTPELEISYDLFKSLIDATHCSFILLAMRRLSRPIDIQDVVSILSLNVKQAAILLVHFGFIIPVENSQAYTITQSGIEMISSKPDTSPFQFDPSCDIEGDRLPSYVALDLLPLRLYTYYLNKRSQDEEH